MRTPRVAIVGLPNVGKSTLFNALARESVARAANFPFCTVEPNRAPAVPVLSDADRRLGEDLARIAGSRRFVPARLEFVDVAGLVKGASRGEGLGNRFLATVRECDCVVHVLRVFPNGDVVHVDGRVDPVVDAGIVHDELLLADAAHVERRLERTSAKKNDDDDDDKRRERRVLETILEGLREGVPARFLGLSDEEKAAVRSMGLLTLKPVVHAFNVDDADVAFGRDEAEERVRRLAAEIAEEREPDPFVLVCATLEEELASRDDAVARVSELCGTDERESRELVRTLGSRVLPDLVARRLLSLSMCYTGPGVAPERSRTTKAHLFRSSSLSPSGNDGDGSSGLTAAGLAATIHGDLERGFVRAEVVSAKDLVECGSYNEAKDAGLVGTHGRDYEIRPNDVVLVKWRE